MTGITLGTCTTGINLSGTMSTGINVSGTFAAGQAFIVGAFGTPISYTGNELVEIHGRQTSATDSYPLMRVRASTTSGTAMTTGGITAIQAQAYNTGTDNCANIEAIQAHVGIKANATIIANVSANIPNMRAGWFKLEDLGNDLTLTGSAAVLMLGMQWNTGTTLSGNCDWIKLVKEGSLTDPADAIIRVYDGAGGGVANFLLDIPAALPYDAANSSNTQSGKIAVNVGGSTKYIQCYSD